MDKPPLDRLCGVDLQFATFSFPELALSLILERLAATFQPKHYLTPAISLQLTSKGGPCLRSKRVGVQGFEVSVETAPLKGKTLWQRRLMKKAAKYASRLSELRGAANPGEQQLKKIKKCLQVLAAIDSLATVKLEDLPADDKAIALRNAIDAHSDRTAELFKSGHKFSDTELAQWGRFTNAWGLVDDAKNEELATQQERQKTENDAKDKANELKSARSSGAEKLATGRKEFSKNAATLGTKLIDDIGRQLRTHQGKVKGPSDAKEYTQVLKEFATKPNYDKLRSLFAKQLDKAGYAEGDVSGRNEGVDALCEAMLEAIKNFEALNKLNSSHLTAEGRAVLHSFDKLDATERESIAKKTPFLDSAAAIKVAKDQVAGHTFLYTRAVESRLTQTREHLEAFAGAKDEDQMLEVMNSSKMAKYRAASPDFKSLGPETQKAYTRELINALLNEIEKVEASMDEVPALSKSADESRENSMKTLQSLTWTQRLHLRELAETPRQFSLGLTNEDVK